MPVIARRFGGSKHRDGPGQPTTARELELREDAVVRGAKHIMREVRQQLIVGRDDRPAVVSPKPRIPKLENVARRHFLDLILAEVSVNLSAVERRWHRKAKGFRRIDLRGGVRVPRTPQRSEIFM